MCVCACVCVCDYIEKTVPGQSHTQPQKARSILLHVFHYLSKSPVFWNHSLPPFVQSEKVRSCKALFIKYLYLYFRCGKVSKNIMTSFILLYLWYLMHFLKNCNE